MKILLTGAFGNLGSSALPELLRQGHQVRCLTSGSREHKSVARRFAGQVEVIHGDVREPAKMRAAVQGQEAIIHLAYIIPPDTDEQPEEARAVNIDGTRNLLEAAASLATPPKFLFASSLDVFGPTQHLPPPRKVSDPVQASDQYSTHKIACEEMVKASGLPWTILRFADIPPMKMRAPHPIMYRIPLETRFETVHTHDAGLAVANAINSTEVWGRILLIGGGAACQIRYKDYLGRSLEIMGIGMLPESAFSSEPYVTDWLDSEESEHLLNYQHHSFDDIMQDLQRIAGYRRALATMARPVARWWLLRMSPFYKRVEAKRA